MNRFLSYILSGGACLCLMAVAVSGDTIKLKNGSVIKGKVATYNEREFTVYLDLGTSTKKTNSRMVIAIEDIESIQFDDVSSASNSSNYSPPSTYTAPPTQTSLPSKQPNPQPITPAAKSPEAGLAMTEKTVSVIAAADWTSTEIKVVKGQRIMIAASGQVGLGGTRRAGPEGISQADSDKLLADAPTGSLIAVIGDDNNEFIAVGSANEFTAQRDGVLFLSVNEGNLKDNTGSFSAHIRVYNR